MKKLLQSFGSTKSRFCQMLLIVAAVLVGQNAWADGEKTEFSMTVTSTSNVSVDSKQTLTVTSTHADITGSGTVTLYNDHKDTKTMINKNKYIDISSANTSYCKIELSEHTFAVGDNIKITGGKDDDYKAELGIYVSGSEDGTKKTTSTTSYDYTVATDDGICGGKTLYIFKNGNAKYFKVVTITSSGDSPKASDLAVSSSECSVEVDKSVGLTYTTSSSGGVSAQSSDENVATFSIDEYYKKVTITGVKAGTATITLTQAADNTYAAGTKTITVTVQGTPQDMTVTVSAAGIATLYSAYNLVVPDGVEVYGYSYDGTSHMLIPGEKIISGSILPKENGYVVKASAGEYTFTGTNNAATAYSSVLTGCTTDTQLSGGKFLGKTTYGFANKDGKLGLYKFHTTSTLLPAGRAVYVK